MRRTGVMAASWALGLAGTLSAQTVTGHLTDSVTRTPLPGTFVTLVDDRGTERARVLSNQAGTFQLTAPTPGTYHLRSKRIGFRPYVSPALNLQTSEALTYDVAIDPIPIVLPEVVVAGRRQCNVNAAPDPAVAALWDEMKEALSAVSWTSKTPGYWYEIFQFQRNLNAHGNRLGEDSTWHQVDYRIVPFRSAPAEQLAASGYVVVGEEGWTYFSPDADVLVSNAFLFTHCFETKVGHGDTDGLLGLAFTPVRGGELPDVRGTLWLDAKTSQLHHVEFTYVRLPEHLVSPRAGGHVAFSRMPSGLWIVSEWLIRMPIAQRRRSSSLENSSDDFPTVVGFRERGGTATAISAPAAAIAAAQPPQPLPPPPPLSAVQPPPPAPAVGPAPAPAPAPGRNRRRGGDPDVLTPEDWAGTTATNAFLLVQQYRSNWLRTRGQVSIIDPTAGELQVYVNHAQWGDVTRLRDIPIEDVKEMRLLRGPEATTRYGVNHVGGVIDVTTR